MLSDQDLKQAADLLYQAERDRAPIEPIHDTLIDAEIADAYQIQLINIARRVQEGAQIRGNKVGLTAKVMQEMLGVDEPDYGHIMSDMIYKSGDQIAADSFCSPKIEVEIAFVLKEGLEGPGCTPMDVFRATEFIVPVFELIDSRVLNWKIQLLDTIADNASAAGVVLGDTYRSPIGLDLSMMGVLLQRNGEIVETGAGGAVLGNPANAVAWLANKLAGMGQQLAAGSIVLPGSCTRAIDVAAGDTIRADIDRLGSVTVTFT